MHSGFSISPSLVKDYGRERKQNGRAKSWAGWGGGGVGGRSALRISVSLDGLSSGLSERGTAPHVHVLLASGEI